MRILVLGGTAFIGRRIVELLAQRGDQVMVVHRGVHCPAGLPDVAHLHTERSQLRSHKGDIERFAPDGAIDTFALTAADATAGLSVLYSIPTVVLSSMDVYRAFASLNAGTYTDALPLSEAAHLRADRYPYRDLEDASRRDYSKLDVEDRYLRAGAAVLRLPLVYGPRDGQRREWPVLRRILAGRTRIPTGVGNLLIARAHVDDVAAAALAAIDAMVAGRLDAGGRIFHLAEPAVPVCVWWEQIAAAAGAQVSFVRVPDAVLPPDLSLSARFVQHVVADTTLVRTELGWHAGDPAQRVAQSVTWHLQHATGPTHATGLTHATGPTGAGEPEWTQADAAADDAALAQALD